MEKHNQWLREQGDLDVPKASDNDSTPHILKQYLSIAVRKKSVQLPPAGAYCNTCVGKLPPQVSSTCHPPKFKAYLNPHCAEQGPPPTGYPLPPLLQYLQQRVQLSGAQWPWKVWKGLVLRRQWQVQTLSASMVNHPLRTWRCVLLII